MIRLVKIIIFSGICLLSLFQLSVAKVSASVDRTGIAQNETFTLTLHLDNFNSKADLSVLDKSFTVYDTSTSSQTTIVNGKSTSSFEMKILLMPRTSGKVEIPAISIGNEKTQPITLDISEGSTNKEDSEYKKIFAIGTVSTKSGYVGSPIIYTLKLYYSAPVSGLKMKPFEIKSADIRETSQGVSYQKQMKGRTYDVLEQAFLVIPEKTGKIHIPSIVLQTSVAKGFGQFGYDSVYVSTDPIDINVNPIPKDISIDDWFPATDVKLTDSWSETKNVKVGELLTRTVVITAEDVLSSNIPKLDFQSTDEFNIYPEKPTFTDVEKNGHVFSTATYKIGYMPTKEGQTQIPELNVKWYDTANHKSKDAKIAAKDFNIAAGKPMLQLPVQQPQFDNTQVVVKQDDKWRNVAYTFMALWLMTLVALILVLRRKPKQKEPLEIVDKKVKVSTQAIKKACAKKDAEELKKVLLAWAEKKYDKQVFSLKSISELNPCLENVLEQLNATLYAGYKDFDYNEFYKLFKQSIKKVIKKEKANKSADILSKGLYD